MKSLLPCLDRWISALKQPKTYRTIVDTDSENIRIVSDISRGGLAR